MLGLVLMVLAGLVVLILVGLFIWFTPRPRASVEAENSFPDPFQPARRFPFPHISTTSPEPEQAEQEQQKGLKGVKRKAAGKDNQIDISLIFPAFREGRRLPAVLSETVDYLEARQARQPHFRWEVIIVDDGSQDGGVTSSIGLEEFKRRKTRDLQRQGIEATSVDLAADDINIRVCTLLRNRGKGGAVTQGVLRSRGRFVLFLDADGATQIDCCQLLEQALQPYEYAVAIGTRSHTSSSSSSSSSPSPSSSPSSSSSSSSSPSSSSPQPIAQRHWLRIFLMRGFQLYVRIMGIRGVQDTQCGFKMFTRSAARAIFPSMHVEGFIFDIEVLLLANYLGIPILEIPVAWEEKDGSTLNLVRDSIRMARDLLILRLNYFLGFWSIPQLPSSSSSNQTRKDQ